MRTKTWCGRRLATLTACALLLSLGAGQAQAASVLYTTKVHTEDWLPIRKPDMETAIAQHVVEQLSKSGTLNLTRLKGVMLDPQSAKADLSLDIVGDLIGEAGNFSVTLTLRPLSDASYPSFAASATVSVGKRRRPQIYSQLVKAAKLASGRLMRAFRHHLEGGKPASQPRVSSMFDWSKLKPPSLSHGGADFRLLANTGANRDARLRAGERLSGLAYDNAAIRHLIERIALSDPDPVMRIYAIHYLGPSSRQYRFTQRVLLTVLREDSDPKVRSYALSASRSFVHDTTAETVQSWVELLRSKPAEFDRMRDLERLLKSRPNAPNLDAALVACLTQKVILISRSSSSRISSCLSIMRGLPPRRQLAVFLAYMRGPHRKKVAYRPGSWLTGIVSRGLGDCHRAPLMRKAALSFFKRSRDEAVRAGIAGGFAKAYLTAPMVAALYDGMDEVSHSNHMVRMFANLLRAAERKEPPWTLRNGEALKKTLEKLKTDDWTRFKNRRAEPGQHRLKRIDAALAAIASQPDHRKGLEKHLDAHDMPKPSALGYFVKCIEDGADSAEAELIQSDCARGLRWVAKINLEQRHHALAAATGLLSQKRIKIHPAAAKLLGRLPGTLSHIYRWSKNIGSGGSYGKCGVAR